MSLDLIDYQALAAALRVSRLIRVLPPHDRDDVVQATVAILLSRYRQLPEDDQRRVAFKVSKLLTIKCLHALRGRSHEPRSTESTLSHAVPLPLPTPDDRATIEDRADWDELRVALHLEIQRGLSDAEREALRLRFFQGMTLKQIAVQIGAPVSTVHDAIGRALVKLQRRLSRYADLFAGGDVPPRTPRE